MSQRSLPADNVRKCTSGTRYRAFFDYGAAFYINVGTLFDLALSHLPSEE
jgi:hypothetical protein